MTPRVLVVGGGVGGLATAHALRKAIPDPADLEILGIEAGDQLGGSLSTERRDGFVIEAGADSFLTTDPAAVRWVHGLGFADRLVGVPAERQRTYILHRGRLHPMPDGLRLIATPRLGPILRTSLLSWRGKLRAAQDLVRPRRRAPGDESLASFVRRRLGSEVLDRIAGPMVAGIHAGDPERLSMDTLLPRFVAYERERGSVIRGLHAEARGARPRDPATPAPFASFRDGMAELAGALLERTPAVAWRTGVAAEQTERGKDGGLEVGLDTGELLAADAVVLATPAHTAARLVRPLDSGLADALGSIHASSSAVVSLAFPEASVRALDGTGFLVPRTEGLRLTACTWSSSKFPGRAPPGHILARAFYGGAGDESILGLMDEDLVALALDELRGPLALRGEPELTRVHRWPAAHPQYEVGHRERVAAIEARAARHRGLHLTGSSYRGIGIPDCARDAQRTAAAILESFHLKASVPAEAVA